MVEFLLARIAEDEELLEFTTVRVELGRKHDDGGWSHESYPFVDRWKAECEAKRRIVELHQAWPVLVTQPPEFEGGLVGDLDSVAIRMSQRMKWLTEQEYRAAFGDEPPTSPILAALAAVYADHPDYNEAWRTG